MKRASWVWILGLLLLPWLSGCGTTYATVPNVEGRPVMLLGYDPVAYFTVKEPQRGDPALRVDLPERSYYFATREHMAQFQANPARYEPQYGGFCASGAAFAIKLGSDPTSWTVHDGRLFIFGDILGKTAWGVDPAWNVAHGDEQWPAIRDKGWRGASLASYANKVPYYKTGEQIKQEWLAKNPGQAYPSYDSGGMVNNLFLKPPGWRAAEGFGQPALGYPK